MTLLKKGKLFIIIATLFCCTHSSAMYFFSNYSERSLFSLPNPLPTSIFTYNANINGSIKSWQKINVHCASLQGTGTLKAPEIFILAKTFNFTGTIDCSKKCTIIVCNDDFDFDQNMFMKKGEGRLNIINVPQKEFLRLFVGQTCKATLNFVKYPLIIGASVYGTFWLYNRLKNYW